MHIPYVVNIGFVTHYYDREEGTGGYAVEVVSRLAREHAVTLYAAGVRTPPPANVTVVRVPALTLKAYATILTFPAAFAAVRRRHDVVHAQGWVANEADVVTAHIVLAAWRDAARTHGVRAPTGERLLGRWVATRELELLARAAAVIAPSVRARDDILHRTARRDGVHAVPHGCERALTLPARADARARCRLDPAAFVAAYVGDARKGLRTAVAALGFAPDAHLLVLSRAARDDYADLAAAAGAADRLHWAPEGAAATDVFGAADVVLQPTIYDTFGMVIGEALALGLPVITSAQAGAAELLEHGASAWLLRGLSGDEAGGALQALRVDAALRQRLVDGGRAVAARWTWDETVRRTVSVYDAVRRG